MSGVTLSNAVRQNLLSLQNTAQLASITQNRLATGKKVNSALDNPVNFFTASGLDARANDISNLLDGIGNGIQVLKGADTGITSLTFTYLKGDNSTATNREDIRSVQIQITAATASMTDQIRLRTR